MEEGVTKNLKHYIKHFWWVALIVAAVLMVATVVTITQVNHAKDRDKEVQKQAEEAEAKEVQEQLTKDIQEGRKPPMTEVELVMANTALATGITIDDGNNDFTVFPPGTIEQDGRPDNSSPWPLPFADLKNVQIGADETYLYAKYQFWGSLPDEMYRNGDDFLVGVGVNMGLQNYLNHNTGKVDGSGLFQVGLSYAAASSKDSPVGEYGTFYNPPKLDTSTFGEANSAVKDKAGEDTYGIATGEGKTFGAAGLDYMVVAFPLANLGLQYGDTINFNLSAETSSKVFHHQSIDPLLDFGSAKMGKTITWKIGSNNYTAAIPKF
jgi:hypothetical protein